MMSRLLPVMLILLQAGLLHAQEASYLQLSGFPFPEDEVQESHQILLNLKGKSKLMIEFSNIYEWEGKGVLPHITTLASDHVLRLQDSFKEETTTKSMLMNIPDNEQTIILNLRQSKDNNQMQLAWQGNEYYNLKTAMDTLTIIKNNGYFAASRTKQVPRIVKYTFILKDIHEITELDTTAGYMEGVEAYADSIIALFVNKRPAKDDFHTLRYDQEKNTKVISYRLFDHLAIYSSMGGIIYKNKISPYLEASFIYKFASREKIKPYAGLNVAVFYGYTGYKFDQGYSTVSLEWGLLRQVSPAVTQRSYVQLGIMFSSVSPKDRLFHMGLTYSINSLTSIGLTLGTNFKSDNDKNIIGVNFKFSFL